jgi:hypothetical protein
MVEPPEGQLTKPLKNHHRYVHGLRTKEVITMRKLLSQMLQTHQSRLV